MNKHTKLAIFLAPFLLIGGYIAADYFSTPASSSVYALSPPAGKCFISTKQCVLSAGDFSINIYQEENKLVVNSNFALSELLVFIVGKQDTAYRFTMENNAFYWKNIAALKQMRDKQIIRVIATVNENKYISEFTAFK